MKNPLFIVTLFGLISFGASAAQYNHHDENISERYSNELRLKAFEGKPAYQVKVIPQLLVDRDESTSTQRATELRKQALVGEAARDVESFVQRDRDEPVSTLHATNLRLKSLDSTSVALTTRSGLTDHDSHSSVSVDDVLAVIIEITGDFVGTEY